MPKQKADDGLRQLFMKHLTEVDWWPIESGTTHKGIPDLNGCYLGHEFWVECKATHANQVNISPFQIAKTQSRLRAGGAVFLAVRKRATAGPRKGEAVDGLYLIPGLYIRGLAEYGLKFVDDLPPLVPRSWHGGPNNWNWGSVLTILIWRENKVVI